VFASTSWLLGGLVKHDSELAPIPPETVVGHVHLKVADLERAVHFYSEVLGFDVMQRMGDSAAFLSAGGYHHHVGLNTWESEGGPPAPRGSAGLYHVAFRYPNRRSLADALRRLQAFAVALKGAADHGVSEALYLRDPDGNGVELYWDRPESEWPRESSGALQMVTKPLDLQNLLATD
jgi:catechol 2,3-dioxygenase